MRIILFVIFASILFSCKKDSVEKSFYPSGNLIQKSYYNYDNGKLEKTLQYYDSIPNILKKSIINKGNYDSIKIYYKNGTLYEEGKRSLDSLKFGNWIRYTIDGYKSDIKEYFIIKDDYVLNRKFYFNKNGDTLWHASKFNQYNQQDFIGDTLSFRNSTMDFFMFHPSDTINLNDNLIIDIEINSPVYREHDSEIKVFLAKEEANYNERFSNEHDVEFDTLYNMNFVEKYQHVYPKEYWNYIVISDKKFKTTGEKLLRGYVKEYFNRNPTKNNTSIGSYTLTYFQKKIYVQDTLE